MTLPASLVRRRAAQGIILVVLVASAPVVAGALWPDSAKFVPPPLLSMLVLLSVFYALLIWRSQWVFKAVFQGHLPPAKLVSVTQGHRIGAGIGLLLSAFLAVLWLRSLI
jgi:hypothetical protein